MTTYSFTLRASDELIQDAYEDVDEVQRRMQRIANELEDQGYGAEVSLPQSASGPQTKQSLRARLEVRCPPQGSAARLRDTLTRVLRRNALVSDKV